jgi:hypothetical protein
MNAVLASPPANHAPRTPDAPAPELIGRLQGLLRQNRRRWRTVILFEAVGWAVALPLAYLWLVFFLDTQFHLPLAGRLLAAVGVLAGLAWAVRHLVLRWRQLHLTEDEVALAIERETPGHVQNRLINAVQLARTSSGDTRRLSDAVIQENYDRLQQVHLEQAARLRPAVLRAGFAALMVAVGVAFCVWAPERFANSAARILFPLATIEPIYRTQLAVEPGDIEAVGDVALRITIDGELPESLVVLKKAQGKLGAEEVAVHGARVVSHTFRDVNQTFFYAVRGGDFTSPYYQVTVPQKVTLARVRVTYRYPAYAGLEQKSIEGTTGELEALHGTTAQVTFVLDQPAEAMTLTLDRPASAGAKSTPAALTRSADGKEFAGEIGMDQAHAYRLEIAQGKRGPQKLGPFPIRVVKDQEPKLELIGLERRTDVQVDSTLPLKIVASDDYGLVKVGLFTRRVLAIGKNEEPWEAAVSWDAGGKTSLQLSHELAVTSLNVAEGEKLELALRALDTDPARNQIWTTGAIYELSIGGEGAGLQRQYEQIIQSEAELKGLIAAEQALLGPTVEWLKKLDGSGDLRWDDPKNVDALHKAVGKLTAEQAVVQKHASQVVKAMPAHAGNIRIAVGLLADTEMVRAQRILDSVPGRDKPQAKRTAVADARITQERIIRSLQDLADQYAGFRADWELTHMIPFAKMLAERQTKMRDQSKQVAVQAAKSTAAFQRQSMGRRQAKVLDLCKLITPAFVGLAERLKDQDADLAKAYAAGSTALASDSLLKPMRDATEDAKSGRWGEVVRNQTAAADGLTALHDRLRQAQIAAAQKALAALREKAKSDLEAQKELEKLKPGSNESFVKQYPEGFKVEDMVRIWEVNRKKSTKDPLEEPDFKKSESMFYDKNAIELKEDSGVRQDPYTLKLATVAGATVPLVKVPTDKEKNKVKPFIQEDFDDLVGKLLEEADELHKDYQSLNLSTNQNNNDPGEIGKQGGALNSTGAVAATGNQKPPTLESGGVSRTGRQGARAYGMVADEDTFNRKGRDKALEGQGEVADQAGKNKMKKTDENQVDTSTGVGGKKIDSDDSHFSTHDAGKWKDEYLKRMEKPQKKEYLVERQGDKIDAKVAAQLRDLTSKQEQVIERLKSIKKELKNLYLPTDHLDELAAALQANLETLKEQPDPEMFRQQLQAIDRLRGALKLFQNAGASFQPSLPRDRMIRGRVLDDPSRPALPGYEEAVRQYYLKLATQ